MVSDAWRMGQIGRWRDRKPWKGGLGRRRVEDRMIWTALGHDLEPSHDVTRRKVRNVNKNLTFVDAKVTFGMSKKVFGSKRHQDLFR